MVLSDDLIFCSFALMQKNQPACRQAGKSSAHDRYAHGHVRTPEYFEFSLRIEVKEED
jgi:hypothetical protein